MVMVGISPVAGIPTIRGAFALFTIASRRNFSVGIESGCSPRIQIA